MCVLRTHCLHCCVYLCANVKASALQPLPLTSNGDSKASNKAMKKAKLYTPAATNALQLTSTSGAPGKRQVQQLMRVTIKAEDMNGALAIVRPRRPNIFWIQCVIPSIRD